MSEPRFLTIAVSEPKKNEETLGQFVSYKITSETNWEGYTETNCTVARRYSGMCISDDYRRMYVWRKHCLCLDIVRTNKQQTELTRSH